MSASREKKLRQDLAASGYVDPKIAEEANQKKAEKRVNRLYAIIGIIFVVVVAAVMIWRTNVISRNAPAATINGEKYTASQVNFYFQNAYRSFLNANSYYISYLGLNTNASLKDQVVSESAAELTDLKAGITWYDAFMEATLQHMSSVQLVLAEAEAAGYVYPEGVRVQHEEMVESIKTAADTAGVSPDDYLLSSFGSDIPFDVYSEELLHLFQYSSYVTSLQDKMTFTSDELEAVYNEDPLVYDFVSYEAVKIDGTAPSTEDAEGNKVDPTEEETAAALEAAKKAANELLADVKAGGDMEKLAKEVEDSQYNKMDGAPYYGTALCEWLFDDARKDGEVGLVEASNSFYIVRFFDRFKDDSRSINVRHILVPYATGEKAEGDDGYEAEQEQLKADARAKAEDILNQWKSGAATEESFGELALLESSDGSKYVGGLYTNVTLGTMVEAFEDWCFDKSRKDGDTGIVETPYGAHVMYFVSENPPYWEVLTTSVLKEEAVDAMATEKYESSEIKVHDFGMKFVG